MIEHRPRSPSELVDAAFALLRRDYLRYCLTTALLTAPWLVVQLTMRRALDFDPQAPTIDGLMPAVWVMLASVVWASLLSAVLAQLAAAAYEERPIDPQGAMRTGVRRWAVVLAALLLKYLLVAACFMLGMLGGGLLGSPIIIMAQGKPGAASALLFAIVMVVCGVLVSLVPLARYAPVAAVASLERVGPFAALGRSRSLVKGRARAALGVTLLVLVLYFIVAMGANFLATAIEKQVLPHIVSTLITVLAYPLLVVVNVALYYDLRIRAEGYDLELMTRRLAPQPADGALASPGV